ncbi:GDSL-type esterase/lipase family protein [Aliarcobacter vitoriensis]|uniref:GDSL-type esterase/lipase family protein n=1 Tax=Aliarcobacter vitoriensis TaxID=2011099 RepID=UPI003AAD1A57
MKKIIWLITLFGLFYLFGAVTVQYRLFPFEQIVKLRNSFKANPILVKPYYIDKSSQFKVLSKNDKYKIVMIGDSITDGAEWYELLNIDNIQNRGIGGDTTDGLLARLDSINQSIKKAFIMIGINDIGMYKSIDEIYDNYVKIINTLEEKGIKIYIQSTLYVGKNYPNSKNINLKVDELNKKLKELAKNKDLTFINLNKILAPNGYLDNKYTNDNVHLNGVAYLLWADEIKDYIKNYILF